MRPSLESLAIILPFFHAFSIIVVALAAFITSTPEPFPNLPFFRDNGKHPEWSISASRRFCSTNRLGSMWRHIPLKSRLVGTFYISSSASSGLHQTKDLYNPQGLECLFLGDLESCFQTLCVGKELVNECHLPSISVPNGHHLESTILIGLSTST